MPQQHHSSFQARDNTGKWAGGFVEGYQDGGPVAKSGVRRIEQRPAYADGGKVKDREEPRGLAAIPRHLNAAAGMADHALGGLPSTAVGAIHGIMPGGPGYGDVKSASESALEDFRELYPSVADPMLEMLDNPMGAGFFGLPAFLRRASRGVSAADRIGKANADLEKANADLRRLGKRPVPSIRPIGGWTSADEELADRLERVQRANAEIDSARRQIFDRPRDIARGGVQPSLPAPSPSDYRGVHGQIAEMQPDDLVVTARHASGQRPAATVRRENHPEFAAEMDRQRQQRARDEFRRNLAVEDDLAGGPAQRALTRQDEGVDEFVSNLLGQFRRERLPDLPENTAAPRMRGVERFIVNEALDPLSKGALGDPLPMREVVNSMVRRGYALPGANLHVLQDRDKGRFMAMTPAEREFKDAVRSSPEADRRILSILQRLKEQ